MNMATAIKGVFLVLLIMAAPAARLQASPLPAFSISVPAGHDATNGVGVLGYQFSTDRSLEVDALGTYDHNGSDISTNGGAGLAVTLYDVGGANNGLPVVSTTVTGTDPATALNGGAYTEGSGADAFRYIAVTPFILPAGTYELLVATPSSALHFVFVANLLSSYPGFTLGLSAYNPSGSGFISGGNVNSGNSPGDIGPNLLLSVATPEPSSLLLSGMAVLLGFGYRALRRRSA